MKHVITVERLGILVDPLIKATTGSHLYYKRERFIDNKGRQRYRYWYHDVKQRDRHHKEHDPRGEHEHVLKQEAHKTHRALRKDMPKTATITEDFLQELFGRRTKSVKISSSFRKKNISEFLAKEKEGAAPERNTLQRIAKAMDMVPDAVKQFMTIKNVTIARRDDPAIKSMFETGDKPRPAPATFLSAQGGLVICADGDGMAGHAGINTNPVGNAQYGSGLTLTEELLWHEIGQNILRGIKRRQGTKALVAEFRKLYNTGRFQKISAIANQNWENDFAESFAAMMSHPKQMARQCPERYEFFRENGLVDPGFSAEEVLKEPDADFAWWRHERMSKATRVYNRIKEQVTQVEAPYESDMDEFYSMTVNGRTVYMRMGPQSLDEEEVWDPLPSVIDKKTGLPVYDKKVSARFRTKENYKEIYDEHGNRLDDTAAFMYLNQGSKTVEDKIPDDVSTYKPIPQHGIGYQVYIKLGESRGDPKTERTAVDKLIKQGKLEQERGDRYKWAPLKIDEGEFFAKTPTFKFGQLKSAEHQPYPMLDSRGKPERMKATRGGKKVQAVHSRVYESLNPDGSLGQILVQETDDFEPGETIQGYITAYDTDPTTGKVSTVKRWGEVTLDKNKHGKDLSTKALAALWKVPVDELRRRNGKYGQYQIQDPILNTLVNPMGKLIRNSHELITLLRHAAEAQREAWVSISMGGDIESLSHVHAKVRFDGSGSPLLIGDYWKRKLGKENPRISDLTSGGSVKSTDRVRDRAEADREMAVGKPIYAKVGENFVLGDLTEIRKDGDKTTYAVNVRKGQAAEAGLTVTDAVRRVPTTVDPDRPDIRLRKLHAPTRDVLLYADEMKVDAAGRPLPGSGLVKIKLPANGLFSREEMTRIPGVHDHDGELHLDVNRIDEFRGRVGGFVMDDFVAYRLNKLMQKEQALAAARKSRKVKASKIADPKTGAVNVKGLLKGCREILPWGQPFELGSHQLDGLQAAASNEKDQMSQLFAHNMGTGKTVTAICGIIMAQNLGVSKGRTFVSVPKQTAEEWVQSVSDFTHQNATMIGTMPGAKKIWSPPDKLKNKPPGWSDKRYNAKLKELRDEAWASSDIYWKPHEDPNKIIIISDSYYQRHMDEMIRIGNFDYGVNDEAQGIQYGTSAKSKAWDRLSEGLKGQLLLSGTPMTNKISTIVRYMRLLSKGTIDYGTQDDFEDEFMTESSVMRANGARKAAKMDLNPAKAKQVFADVSPYIHVATSQDVEGKVMPNIHLDENSPVAQGKIQSMMYRFHQGKLTQRDREQFAQAHTLGEDEQQTIKNETARVSVLRARHITNTLAYSPTDNRKDITYEIRDKEGKVTKTVMLRMPSLKQLNVMYHGKWPSIRDVPNKMKLDEYNEFSRWAGHALGKNYEDLAGRTLTATVGKKQMKQIEDGESMNGIKFGSKVANPEYGPEGFICRGVMKSDGSIGPIVHKVRDAKGKTDREIKIPVGTRFIRGANGLYWIAGVPDDHPLSGQVLDHWDWSGEVTVQSASDTEGDSSASYKAGQNPKEGFEQESVNRSPRLREQRIMMDLAATTDNAKTDEFERYIRENTNPKTGNDPDTQFVHFGYAIGSSCRVMEGKLRLMGYQDVNEVLNDALRSPSDGPPATGKYFVTLFGGNASIGDTAINSDIFRRGKGGSDQSMFVHRLMDGTTGKPIKLKDDQDIKFAEGYTTKVRDRIAKLFTGVEAPARVVAIRTQKGVEQKYAYDSDLNKKDRAKVRKLEKTGKGSEANDIYKKYLTDREPLTARHIGVFNNCQHMVASDAAQTGMNWGNATKLSNYDSLFSPMNEAQRFARVARMLDAFVAKKLEPAFDKIQARVEKMGVETKFAQYADDPDSVMSIVEDALGKMPKVTAEIERLSGSYDAATVAETFLLQRSLDRMLKLRPKVEQQLRQEGRTLVNSPMAPDPTTGEMSHQYIKPEEIVSNDITNEIIENHLLPFERQLLRAHKGIVNVKRFITSVEVPEMKRERVKEGNKTRMVEVPTGNMSVEFPSKAEKSVLTRGRAKQVPMEGLFSALQKEWPDDTKFDFLSGSPLGLSHFHKGPEHVLTPQERAERNQKSRMDRKERSRANAAARKIAVKAAKQRRAKEKKAS